jgi:hypothetical protein
MTTLSALLAISMKNNTDVYLQMGSGHEVVCFQQQRHSCNGGFSNCFGFDGFMSGIGRQSLSRSTQRFQRVFIVATVLYSAISLEAGDLVARLGMSHSPQADKRVKALPFLVCRRRHTAPLQFHRHRRRILQLMVILHHWCRGPAA